jgi:hypothetical protein
MKLKDFLKSHFARSRRPRLNARKLQLQGICKMDRFASMPLDSREAGSKRNAVGDMVAVNDRGFTIGEDHSRATLLDSEVRLIRDLRASDPAFWTYRKLAEKFEISKKHAWRICQFQKREQIPDRWVRR